MRFPKIYIIILNYNCWKDTVECVESVLKSRYKNIQVIVIDNNSPDNSMDYIKKFFDGILETSYLKELKLPEVSFTYKPKQYVYVEKEDLNSDYLKKVPITKNKNYPIILIQTGENRGFGAGVNVALRFLLDKEENAFVFLLNPDMVLNEDTIEKLVNCSKNNIGVWGINIYDYYNRRRELFKGGFKVTGYGTVKPVLEFGQRPDFISGSALFCHLDVFRKVGLFDERYFLYWEDADWCFAARNKGFELFFCKDAVGFDKGGKSTGRGELTEYFYTVNLFKFYSKYFPGRKNLMYFFVLLRMIKKFFKGNFRISFAIGKGFWDSLRLKDEKHT
ncbi:glycosyltransferase family 2 protein [Thermotomaculum hydrothermale]|nr:glycosyltransferase family 2 protein [Thermotomaculum hydrothermale]